MATSIRDGLEDDLMFTETQLESLDHAADDFEEQKANLEARIETLITQIDAIDNGDSSFRLDVPPPIEQPMAGPSGIKRSYAHLDPNSPTEGKRSRMHSPDVPADIQATPQPSTLRTNSINGTLGPAGMLSTREQRLAQARLQEERRLARYAQMMQDANLAQSANRPSPSTQRMSTPKNQAIFNRDMSFRNPNVLKSSGKANPYLTNGSRSSHLDQLSPVNMSRLPSQLTHRPVRSQAPMVIDLSEDSPTSGNSMSFVKPEPGIKSEGRIKSEYRPQQQFTSQQPRDAQSPGSGSDSSDLVEISAADFGPPNTIPTIPSSNGQIGYGQALRNAVSGAVGYGMNMYNGLANGSMMPGVGPPMYANGSMPGTYPGQTHNYSWMNNDPLMGMNGGAPPNGSRYDPFPVLDDDVYRQAFGIADNVDSRFNYMYADTSRTAEELNALLENIRPDEEIPAHLREGTPEAMAITLMEHQKVGLSWLQKQEDGVNKGGVLADDMGLGKTVQAIALMVSRPSDDPVRKTNLIIAPVALMNQWQVEIQEKLKPGKHQLTVYKYHGSAKKPFDKLKQYDVVLTTYGSLAQELKKRERWEATKRNNPNALPSKGDQLNLIGDHCKWYRVIIDEAQCIKNRGTATAKASFHIRAKYRLCMTGTPMMNNVTELFSLIHFCRIKPYSNWDSFRKDIQAPLSGKGHQHQVDQAMKRLQSLIRAVMLRRTKKSKLDGKPLITLPDRETGRAEVVLNEEERTFYSDMEQRQQMQFNRYYKAGTVMKNYAHVLTLLLRLRQACCHPHLAIEFASQAEIDTETMEKLSKALKPDVINRVREQEGNFECPICYDAFENPMIFFPCGHFACAECLSRLTDPSRNMHEGDETTSHAKCPACRGDVDPKKVLNFLTFKKTHQRELLTEEEKAAMAEDGEADANSDSSSDEEDDDESETNSLDGFIVNDDEEENVKPTRKGKGKARSKVKEEDSETEDEIEAEDAVAQAGPSRVKDEPAEDGGDETADEDDTGRAANAEKKAAKRRQMNLMLADSAEDKSKSKTGKGKGKGKKKEKSKSLAALKAEAMRSKKGKARYLKRLAKFYEPSSKIERMMELIDKIQEEARGEKILIFSQFTSLLDLCEIPMRAKYNYTRYDGSMSAAQRVDSINEFRKNASCVAILISLKAGNAGLNLNFANHVIMLDPFWNPYIEEQAIDRAHRIGQTRKVQVHRLLAGETVEDRIVELQEKKRDLIEQALDEDSGRQISRLGQRELAYLFGVTRSL